MDVDTIALDADLGDEIVGLAKLLEILPKDWAGSAKTARQGALNDVLLMLSRRTPPIVEGDLTIPAELKTAVVYGALERVYRRTITESGDVHDVQRKLYEKKFGAELMALAPTISGSSRGNPYSIAFHRR